MSAWTVDIGCTLYSSSTMDCTTCRVSNLPAGSCADVMGKSDQASANSAPAGCLCLPGADLTLQGLLTAACVQLSLTLVEAPSPASLEARCGIFCHCTHKKRPY